MAYSDDIRTRVLACYDEGEKTQAIARRLKLSPAYTRRVKQHRHEPRPKRGGSKPKLDEAARAKLAGWVEQTPDATLQQLRTRLAEELKVAVSIGCLWTTLRRMKLSYKKSR